MPTRIGYTGGKYRLLLKKTGKPELNADGKPVDGGGHSSKRKARAQQQAIAISQLKKAGKFKGK